MEEKGENEFCSSVLNPVNTLLLPSGSIRQRNFLSEASRVWWALLSHPDASHSSENLRKLLCLIWPSLAPVLGYTLPPSCLCCCVVQSDLGGDHGDCVKAICGGDDWPKPEVPAWRQEEMCLLLSSTGPQSLPLSVCATTYTFLLRLLTQSFFVFFSWPQTAFENTDVTCENLWDVEPKGSNCGSFRTYSKRENSEVLMWNSVSFQSDCGGNYEKTLLKICGGED